MTRLLPGTRLGYEEYAARALQLWGFEVDRAAVGGQYQTTQVAGVEILTQRSGSKPRSQSLHGQQSFSTLRARVWI